MHNGSKGSLSLGKRSSSSGEEEGEERAKMCDISIWADGWRRKYGTGRNVELGFEDEKCECVFFLCVYAGYNKILYTHQS